MIVLAAKVTTIAAMILMALLTPVAAVAAEAGRPGYQNVPNSAGETGFRGPSSAGSGQGALPFTGLNLLLLVALGCFLLVCGLLLARASRERS